MSMKPKHQKTNGFDEWPETALGAGALPFGVPVDSITWRSHLLNLEETLATFVGSASARYSHVDETLGGKAENDVR